MSLLSDKYAAEAKSTPQDVKYDTFTEHGLDDKYKSKKEPNHSAASEVKRLNKRLEAINAPFYTVCKDDGKIGYRKVKPSCDADHPNVTYARKKSVDEALKEEEKEEKPAEKPSEKQDKPKKEPKAKPKPAEKEPKKSSDDDDRDAKSAKILEMIEAKFNKILESKGEKKSKRGGLTVRPDSKDDRIALNKFFANSKYTAEYNREFDEFSLDEENPDSLEAELTEIFNKKGISASFSNY